MMLVLRRSVYGIHVMLSFALMSDWSWTNVHLHIKSADKKQVCIKRLNISANEHKSSFCVQIGL